VTEANQLQQQIQMYENMALNTANLPQQLYGNIASDLNGVNTIMGRVQGISYAASSLDSTFASHFPGYQAYSAQPNMSNMTSKYQQWSNDMNTSTHSVFSAAQAQNSQMTSETQLLNSLQSQNMSAQGRQQSAQIANELSAQQVAQMQKLRQLVMLQMQQEGTFLQTQADQDAQRSANGTQAMQPANLANTGNTRY
jgi:type IV secretion system protein TrbJ